jgi:hypothetical protein
MPNNDASGLHRQDGSVSSGVNVYAEADKRTVVVQLGA